MNWYVALSFSHDTTTSLPAFHDQMDRNARNYRLGISAIDGLYRRLTSDTASRLNTMECGGAIELSPRRSQPEGIPYIDVNATEECKEFCSQVCDLFGSSYL